MNNLDYALLVEVGFIVHEDIGYSRTFDFDFSHLTLDSDLELHDLSGIITISRTSEGLLAQAEFGARIQAECSRCLEDSYQVLETEFSELFVFPSHAVPETETLLPASNRIDFAPILREYMLIEVPINSICQLDCQGLCPHCGLNRNRESCNCQDDAINPQFAALKSLLDTNLDKSSGAV
jgi:uncharacterized protein